MSAPRLAPGIPMIDDPLPRHFLTSSPGTGGTIKARPEDFIVEELPLYEPRGTGEHLYLAIEKIGVSHAELMATLRRRFGVDNRRIGYAGMKDKIGVTRQTVSIHAPRDVAVEDLDHDRIRILWATRHANMLRRGHLAGNRFIVRVRDVDPLAAPSALGTLRRLERDGVPNYFGFQRFGYRRNNHLLGAALLLGRWEAVLAELLGTRGTPFPEHQRPQRERFEAGEHAEALPMWSRADAAERAATRALAQGRSARAACAAIPKTTRRFWTCALQSSIFNRLLDRRLDAGTLAALEAGDLAWKHDSRAVFRVTADVLADPDTDARLARLEISPSGPLWGSGMTEAEGEVAARERAAIRPEELADALLGGDRQVPRGERRPLRVPIRHVDVEGGLDEHGPYLKLSFELPRGSYATVALREVTKAELA